MIRGKDGASFVSAGVVLKVDDETIEITELPIEGWIQKMKELLESMMPGQDKEFIKDFKDYHTDTKVRFVVRMTPEKMMEAEEMGRPRKQMIELWPLEGDLLTDRLSFRLSQEVQTSFPHRHIEHGSFRSARAHPQIQHCCRDPGGVLPAETAVLCQAQALLDGEAD